MKSRCQRITFVLEHIFVPFCVIFTKLFVNSSYDDISSNFPHDSWLFVIFEPCHFSHLLTFCVVLSLFLSFLRISVSEHVSVHLYQNAACQFKSWSVWKLFSLKISHLEIEFVLKLVQKVVLKHVFLIVNYDVSFKVCWLGS